MIEQKVFFDVLKVTSLAQRLDHAGGRQDWISTDSLVADIFRAGVGGVECKLGQRHGEDGSRVWWPLIADVAVWLFLLRRELRRV
ncbi:MAG: hypothetical protein AAFQ21_16020, partial [Pseudomonadota bacterium]